MASCPYCFADYLQGALVRASCARDIAIPATLIAERDELVKKRDALCEELRTARKELERILNRKRSR